MSDILALITYVQFSIGQILLRGFAFFAIRIYVLNETRFQVVLMASDLYFYDFVYKHQKLKAQNLHDSVPL